MLYVVTYDSPSNRRRKKISDLLTGYGRRVQYSVFECFLSDRKYRELKKRLQPRINPDEDSLRIYPLADHSLDRVEIWGFPPLTQPPASTII